MEVRACLGQEAQEVEHIPAEELRTLALNNMSNKGRHAYITLTETFKGAVNYHDIMDIKKRIHNLRVKGTEDVTPILNRKGVT